MRGALTTEQRLRQSNTRLKNENARLRARVTELEGIVKTQAVQIEKLTLQVDELTKIIFGKGKKKKDKDDDDIFPLKKRKKAQRDKESYQRKQPEEDEITEEKYYEINRCPDCEGKLVRKKIVIFFEEEIPLQKKKVIKHKAEKGYCSNCQKWHTAIRLPSSKVIIGKNVKLYICYLSILLRMSFEQIRNLFKDTFNFHLSDGEIDRILEKEAIKLRSEYERLAKRIKKEKVVHYDETPWKVQKEQQGNYSWVMTPAKTDDVVFSCGVSRGKGNIEKLKGENDKQIGVSDDYAAYRNAFEFHQLCWAHPYRKLRDLANFDFPEKEKKKQCQKIYKKFKKLYSDLRKTLEEDFDLDKNKRIRAKLMKRFDKITQEKRNDPQKLKKLKTALARRKDRYFTCLLHKDVPADNNKAERALRHLVLKRKVSFGSKTQKGADRLSILLSVLLSTWNKSTNNFFKDYAEVRGV